MATPRSIPASYIFHRVYDAVRRRCLSEKCSNSSTLSARLVTLWMKQGATTKQFDCVWARLDCLVSPVVCYVVGLLLFGWALETDHNVPAAVAGTCLLALSAARILAIVTTSCVDMHPRHASAASSALSLVRCMVGALGVGVLDSMQRHMEIEGCYTFWAALSLVTAAAVVL